MIIDSGAEHGPRESHGQRPLPAPGIAVEEDAVRHAPLRQHARELLLRVLVPENLRKERHGNILPSSPYIFAVTASHPAAATTSGAAAPVRATTLSTPSARLKVWQL